MARVICFHKPDEENGFLSNWYKSDFTIDGITYTSMEQYMMHEKATVFHDREAASRILSSSDVAAIKAIGRTVRNYDDRVWNGLRQIIIYRGLVARFSQNESLKKELLNTGDSFLAECAVSDRIWGIGLSMHDQRRFDISSWNGQNLLGFALMAVREELRK
ncbi:MAG: NADAR family protein [Bullifex sp.]